MPDITIPSYGSVFVRLTRRDLESGIDEEMGSGTAFVVSKEGALYLVTNWHVVTGTNQITGEQAARYLPDTIWVDFHSDDVELAATHHYPLYDDSRPQWMVHPERGHEVDIAVLKISLGGSSVVHVGRAIRIEPYQLDQVQERVLIEPTTDVSVIGYPFGQRSAGTLGIWTRGTVATEPDLPYQGDPVFLIDCRARKGQSGSPVIVYRPAMSMTRFANGHAMMLNGAIWELLGVYAGRINDGSDLGRVWKRHLIDEIIAGDVQDTFDFF